MPGLCPRSADLRTWAYTAGSRGAPHFFLMRAQATHPTRPYCMTRAIQRIPSPFANVAKKLGRESSSRASGSEVRGLAGL